MKLTTPIADDWCYLARHMRPDEAAEFAAFVGGPFNPDVAARTWITTPGPVWCLVGDDGLPLCAGGFCPIRPGVYAAWAVGTAVAWEQHWHAVTRTARRLIKAMLASEAHRIEIVTLQQRVRAGRYYLHALKLKFEGAHPRAAADGSTTVTYATYGEPHE